MTSHVPLNKLLLSPRNVRKTNVDEDIEGLADSIASKGLLQNLVVSESPTGKGFFEVDAGGRRLRALELLVKRGLMQRNAPIPVLVVPRDDAAEASLAENLQKIAMNAADEFEAFATIIDGYEAGGIVDRQERIANCARRFGVTEKHVEERLRLASLAPEILQALRERRLSIDAAKAYAAYPDQKLQLKVFAAEEKKPESWRHSAKSIQDAMKGRVYSIDHPAVVYVGLETYQANGGRIARELFMGADDRDVILDPSIIDKLAKKKTEEDAQAFAQEEGFAGAVVKSWHGPSWQDAKAPEGYRRTWNKKAEDVPEDQKPETYLAFKIADDGSTLEPLSYYFEPIPEQSTSSTGGYFGETPEQRAERQRRTAIEQRALRLAAPSVAGTPLEGRTFWPDGTGYVPAITEDEETGEYIVAIFVKIPKEAVEAASAEAERLVDEELRAAEAEAAKDAEPGPTDDTGAQLEEAAA